MKYKTAICAIIKNEDKYLIEWIEYHLMIGVEHFYLIDNESTDNTKKFLQYYQNKGLVDYIYYPGDGIQIESYNNLLPKIKEETEFIAIIDLDEYICIQNNNNLYNTLVNFINNYYKLEDKLLFNIGGVALNRKCYGSSNQKIYDNRLSFEKFKFRAESKKCYWVKGIYRTSFIKYIEIHNSIFSDSGIFMVDENYHIVVGAVQHNPHFEYFWINHYFSRSEEEFNQKLNRGWPDKSPDGSNKHHLPPNMEDIERLEYKAFIEYNQVFDNCMDNYIYDLQKRVKYISNKILEGDNEYEI